eukprot:scaffold1334_cov170-Ochromonas_danica.AAC.2
MMGVKRVFVRIRPHSRKESVNYKNGTFGFWFVVMCGRVVLIRTADRCAAWKRLSDRKLEAVFFAICKLAADRCAARRRLSNTR